MFLVVMVVQSEPNQDGILRPALPFVRVGTC